jgi:two-component system, NtrC family, sensor kinase
MYRDNSDKEIKEKIVMSSLLVKNNSPADEGHSNELLCDYAKNAPACMFIVEASEKDSKRRLSIVDANKAAEELVGIKPSVDGKIDLLSYLPAERASEFISTADEAIRLGQVREVGELHSEGNPIREGWYHIMMVPLRADFVAVSFFSMAYQKKIEMAYRESEERLRLVILASGDGIWDWNLANETMFYSARWFAITGYNENEVSNHVRDLESYVHPDDIARVSTILNGYMQKLISPYSVQYRFKTKDGKYKWVRENAQAVFGDDGSPIRIAGSMADIDVRKGAEEDLRRERILLRTLIDNIPDAIFVKDRNCRKVVSNLADVHNMHLELEAQVLGKNDFDLFPKELADGFYADDMKVVQTGLPVLEREEYVINLDGKKKWLLTTKLPLRNERGEIIGLVGIGRDVTSSKLTEQTLRESEKRLSEIIQAFPVPTFMVDKDRKVISWNRAMETLSGVKAETILGKGEHEYAIPFYGERCPVLIDWAIDRSIPDELKQKYAGIKKDTDTLSAEVFVASLRGKEVYLHSTATVLRDSDGEVAGGIESVIDISEIKKSEELLRASEQRFRLISENVVDIIVVLDSQNTCLYTSTSYRDDGVNRDSILGKSFLTYVHPDDALAVISAFNEVKKSYQYQEIFFRFQRSNGDWRIKEATVNALLGDSGVEVLIVMRDVTERVAKDKERMNLQVELKNRNAELEKVIEEIKQMQRGLIQSEKLASIGQLVAGIAHEINNPLAYVSSNLNRFDEYFHEFVAMEREWRSFGENVRDETAYREAVESIQKHEKDSDIESLVADFEVLMKHTRDGAGRIKRIVEQLRGFTHLSDDNLAEADLNTALEDTLSIVWNEIKYKATVKKDYGGIPPVVCNIGEIKQVFVNLLVNAAQAIKEKGEITITTGILDSWIFVKIEDTGSGMSPEVMTKIFDPFFTTKPIGKGTGLGLWVTATIIEKHGGKIRVESEPGKGTKMTITLPVGGELRD